MKNNKPYRKPAIKLALVIIALAIALIEVLAGCAGRTEANAPSAPTLTPQVSVIYEGEDLVIPIADISEQATFYPIEIDGVTLEVLAVKAPDGTIRTAFNTCEVCYDSGRGYYKQEGDVLVCQNCGNRFQTSQIEVESNGCNPWPIFPENKTVDGETITISNEFLTESIAIFQNWKGNY